VPQPLLYRVPLVVIVVNFGREDGVSGGVNIHHQRSRHNHYAITEVVTARYFPVFTVCLYFPLARSSLILMAFPIFSCQFLLVYPVWPVKSQLDNMISTHGSIVYGDQKSLQCRSADKVVTLMVWRLQYSYYNFLCHCSTQQNYLLYSVSFV
jgi:hypothetical protein